MITKDDQLIFRCIDCKKNYEKVFNKDIIKRFLNTNEFYNGYTNKFILLLKKGVYPYEYMDKNLRKHHRPMKRHFTVVYG